MKKRTISFILMICLLVCIFPTIAFANDLSVNTAKSYYENYTAIGDSICAGFSQGDYDYKQGFDITKNIENSPDLCYARQVGKRLGSSVYNLGKPGCDTSELLNILTDDNNQYYDVYRKYIEKSDLITLEIGSNDLLMSTMHSILNCIGEDFTDMSTQEVMALAEPLLTGNIQGIVDSFELVKGIKLSQDQILAIQQALSDDSLSVTMEKAYEIFRDNYPKVVDKIREINQNAELVILNYYNPYKGMNFNWGDINYNMGDVIQVPTDKMNQFTLNYSKDKGYLYVDVTDTLTNIVDPHPSIVGHTQIANHIIDALVNTITATAQNGGTITPAGENIVKEGESLTFSIAANKGYEINDVLVDGKSVGSVNKYTFTNVKSHHSIIASFKVAKGIAKFNTYSALGDSITAGYSLPDYTGDFSNPDNGYVAIAAKALSVTKNYNLALKAYTTKDLLQTLTDSSNKYYARFRSNLKESDLITLDIGSNDLTMTMLDMVLGCLGMNTDNLTAEDRYTMIKPLLMGVTIDDIIKNPENYLGQNFTDEQKKAIFDVFKNENIDERFAKTYEQFTKNWDDIIEVIQEINPDATIAAIGYYNATPDLHFEYNGMTLSIGTVCEKYIEMMNTYISKNAKSKDQYVFVDTTGIELNSICNKITFDPHPSKAGHAEIAARLVDALSNNASKSVISVSLNKTTDSLTVGDTDTLIATINPSDASNKDVNWSSSNPSVATVDSTGKVTAVSAGTADITVTTVDGNKTATCKVTVTNPLVQVISVSLNKTTDNLTVGDTDTLIATINPSDASNKDVNWSSSNPSVATVDSTGKVTAVSAGTADITVTTVDGNKTATCKVTVTNPLVQVISVISVSLNKTIDNLTVGDTDTLIATINPSDASNKDVSWSSSNPSVATVDSTGKVTAVSAGTADITVTTVDGNKTATCKITVIKDDASILPKTGYLIGIETISLTGLVLLLTGIAMIMFKKKEI